MFVQRLETRHHERGGATLEMLLLAPVALLMMLGLLHVGVLVMVNHNVSVAAEQALHETRTLDGTESAGLARAHDTMAGASFVKTYTVEIEREAVATVTIEALGIEVLPGVEPRASATRSAPLEDPP